MIRSVAIVWLASIFALTAGCGDHDRTRHERLAELRSVQLDLQRAIERHARAQAEDEGLARRSLTIAEQQPDGGKRRELLQIAQEAVGRAKKSREDAEDAAKRLRGIEDEIAKMGERP